MPSSPAAPGWWAVNAVESLPQPRIMTGQDIRQVVRLHTLCFSDYFLTGFGKKVLGKFYEYALNDPSSVALVLEEPETGLVIGYAVVTFDSAFHEKVVKNYALGFAWGVIHGIFASSVVRRGLWARRWVVKDVLRKLPKKKKEGGEAGYSQVGTYACLLVNAIHPEWRGWKNSERFLTYFVNYLFDRGATGIWGTVYSQNLPAVILYKRLGWKMKKRETGQLMVWLNRVRH